MSKKIFIPVLLLLVMSAGFFFFWHQHWIIEKDIIYLKSGRLIAADDTWTEDQTVYYRKDRRVGTLSETDVEYVGKGDARQKKKGSDIVKSIVTAIKSEETAPFESGNLKTMADPGALLPRLKPILPWLLLAVILAAAVKVVRMRIKSKPASPGDTIKKEPPREAPLPAPQQVDTEGLSEEDKIALFFLNLYKIQINAPGHAPGEFVPLHSQSSGSGVTYELKVGSGGEVNTRRMTIGEIGEESGSKSKCYYVIYDVHMVLKIPPIPINDFKVYIDNIRKERRIVDKLAPRECIVPKVSVIMKIVHQFSDESDISWDKIEERYIRWLTSNEEKQNHLKIGDTFVYFMDLSRYFFLAHIIDSIHDQENRLVDEIKKHPDIIWRLQEFTGRYGKESYAIYQRLQHMYAQYEQGINDFIMKLDPEKTVPAYKTKEWFLTHLSGRDILPQKVIAEDYPLDKLNILSEDIFNRYSSVVATYHKRVKHQLAEKAFVRNKMQISSISSNLLELLEWLYQKDVAMRDLKPDNLIVAGELEAYPQFLTSQDRFAIGLIDVETAVDMDASDGQPMDQPKLGGTPFYATPSQLFQNDLIQRLFPDLGRILRLQDWYATIAIIYKVITGGTLFGKTAKHLVAFKTKLEASIGKDTPMAAAIAGLNAAFWETASTEFNQKLNKNKDKLTAISPPLKDRVRHMLHREAKRHLKLAAAETGRFIDGQGQVNDETKRAQLYSAGHQQILRLKDKWEERNKPLAKMLSDLSRLKRKEEAAAHMIALLAQSGAQASAYDMLNLMFDIVSNAMKIKS